MAASWRCKDPGRAWAECWSDARWLRRVIVAAGGRPVGSTGSALILTHAGGRGIYIWATASGRTACGWRDRVATVDGIDVCGDRVRITWWAQGARVWLEPPPPPKVLRDLVRAARDVPRR